MKQLRMAWRYFLLIIILLGLIAAPIMCIWAAMAMPRSIAVLGGMVGAAWWTFRIINYQIKK